MSASDEIKETLEHHFYGMADAAAKNWKRVRKFNLNGEKAREFHNAKMGRTVYVTGDEDDYSVFELDQWIYGTWFNPDGSIGQISFEPQEAFARNGHIGDQHRSHILETFFLLPEVFTREEVMENAFEVQPPYDDLTIHILLKKHGLQYSQELTDFLNRNPYNPPAAVVPVNPPLPPALDPNWGAASVTPVVAPSAPVNNDDDDDDFDGYYGTGLEDDGSAKASDFIAVVGNDDGEVFVAITPMLSYARGDGFDQSVGPIVNHLLPSDWYEASEQHYTPGTLCMVGAFDVVLKAGFQVDWPEFKRDLSKVFDIYDVTSDQHERNLDAIANPVTSTPQHHHNPVAAGPINTVHPEFTGQEEAVQEALERARSQGLHGLEQEGKWLDMEEIEEKVDKDYYIISTDGEIHLERSHALWLLFEHYDNGSGLAWPNFFAMDNYRICQELAKIMPFPIDASCFEMDDEDNDEEHVLFIHEDDQAYPAPYDLPVPEYVPVAPIVHTPHVVTTKVPGKQGKGPGGARQAIKSQATGGSFAAVSSGGSRMAQEDEVPENATYIPYCSGDEWVEFCGAVWDNYSTKGAGPVQWSDRYRPRHARIIGLGFKFDRFEYTGVRIKMGYLNEKFEIIDNIDIPGSVFDEVFVDFGGDWNDDGNIQFVEKRKGENPDTGFSYTAPQAWEELEPLLKGKGWLEAK